MELVRLIQGKVSKRAMCWMRPCYWEVLMCFGLQQTQKELTTYSVPYVMFIYTCEGGHQLPNKQYQLSLTQAGQFDSWAVIVIYNWLRNIPWMAFFSIQKYHDANVFRSKQFSEFLWRIGRFGQVWGLRYLRLYVAVDSKSLCVQLVRKCFRVLFENAWLRHLLNDITPYMWYDEFQSCLLVLLKCPRDSRPAEEKVTL